MKCFYHSADLDGHCSGALVKYVYPECQMIGINYGHGFPWDTIEEGETVFMVDFALQPFDQMIRLKKMARLIWIDHHVTELKHAKRARKKFEGIQKVGIGACALVWEYLYKFMGETKEPAEAVRFLADYDVWDHSDPCTLPFQYGFRLFEDTFPDNQKLWRDFIASDEKIGEVIARGQTIIKYEDRQNAKFCKAFSFNTQFEGLRAICANRSFTNSRLFDSVWDPDHYDLMITFARMRLPHKQWTVALYSTKDKIDCGAIAQRYGGGGHKGAAGFQCEQLPFEH